jgi:hypothetical protein
MKRKIAVVKKSLATVRKSRAIDFRRKTAQNAAKKFRMIIIYA